MVVTGGGDGGGGDDAAAATNESEEPPNTRHRPAPSIGEDWQQQHSTPASESAELISPIAGNAHAMTTAFVAEDVALLRNLLDLPPPSTTTTTAASSSNAATGMLAFFQEPEKTRQDHVAGVPSAMKIKSFSDDAMAASQQEQHPTDSSPNSVDEAQFLHTKLRHGSLSAPAADNKEKGVHATTSSRWLQWENPSELLDCADLPNASALEIRRRKNRDSMRRSRQRQRDELDQMKETVAQLESQYEELCLRTGSAAASAPLLRDPSSNPAVQAREYSYLEAIELAKRLGAENLFLKASIQEQASWKLQLHRVLESISLKEQFPPSNAESNPVQTGDALDPEEMRAIFGFTHLSEEEVKDVILDSTRQVQGVQNRLLDDNPQQWYSPRDRLTVLGWDVRRRMDGSEMEFAFVKRFPNASAYQIMKQTWDADLKLDRFKKIKSETRRLDILQQVNANTYVLGRDVRFPDDKSVFRTVYLRFRMETSSELPSSPSRGVSQPLCKNGYVIGTQSINPLHDGPGEFTPLLPCVDDQERLVWADMTLWMEFFNVGDPVSGKEVCEVRWTGKTNYKSEWHAYRSAADTLMGLLRWEALAIKPVVSIC